MIGPTTDRLIPLKDVPALLPRLRRGRKLSFSTVWRWAIRGCCGIKLGVVSVGKTLCTDEVSLRTFIEQLAAARGLAAPAGPGVPTRRQRDREIREAEERLAARGLYVQRKTGEEAGGPLGKGE